MSVTPAPLDGTPTPRSDACAAQANGRDIEQQDYYRMLDLARQFERDLAVLVEFAHRAMEIHGIDACMDDALETKVDAVLQKHAGERK